MGFFTFGATVVLMNRLITNTLCRRRLTEGAYKWPLGLAIGGSVATGIEYIRQRKLHRLLQQIEISDELDRLNKLDNLDVQQFKDHEKEIKVDIDRYRVH